MSRISISHPHPRPCSGRKTLRRCRNREESDNFILIDVDSEYSDYVIVVDVPDYLANKKFRGSSPRKEKKGLFGDVIVIDDDETPEIHHSNVAAKSGSSSADASSSRNACPSKRKKSDVTVEVPPFDQENATPVKLSKCKRTYSGKASTRNRYGLTTDSEGGASDNDNCPDCELMEDSCGKVQEEWEKAFSRRKKDIHNCDSVAGNHETISRGINGNHHQDAEREGATRQHTKVQYFRSKRKLNKEAEAPFFSMKDDAHFGGSHVFNDPTFDDSSMYSLHKEHNHRDNFHMHPQSDFQDKDFVFTHTEPEDHPDYELGSSSRHFKESWEHPESSNTAHKDQSAKEVNQNLSACKDEETPIAEPFPPNWDTKFKDSCYEKTRSVGDDATKSKCKKANQGFRHSENAVCGKFHFSKRFHGSRDEKLKGCHEKNSPPNPEVPLSDHIHFSESELCQDDSSISQREEDKYDRCPDGDALASAESCLISERERLKETDEYRRAMEEEMASRQQALKIQAEEAQHLRRLRKREKEKSVRLLDMERRQKQRVEEIRNTQKKDEENMNTKDVIRAEIRKDLNALEVSCQNMACLLNCLGICVSGWPNPLSHEVQAAYKRALLTFHPDRSSRSDIRQQVEAEEKFKLVNRLKEKFLPLL